jgi:hypothetical protein
MKFVSAVTALVAALAVSAEAKPQKKRVSRRELNQRMKNGNFDKATIMKNAKPHSEAAKKRALGDEDFEMSASYSIQFESCFSLATAYDDLFEGDDDSGMMFTLFSQGNIIALESYAIFKLITANGSNTMMEYIVDLDTYLQSLVNYLPDQMEGFCEACQENAETCQYMLYGNGYSSNYQQNNGYQNNANYGYNNGYNGNRKLSETRDFQHRVLEGSEIVRQLDCQLCEEYSCLNDDDDNGDYDYDTAAEWLEEISQCKETGVSYQGSYQGNYQNNGNNNDDDSELFAGIICNGDGSGVEIGLFLDEDCKLYLPNEAYSNYMSYYDQTYLEMTKEIIEFTFSNAVFSCRDQEITYTTEAVSSYNSGQYNGQYYNGDDDDDDIAEWCEDLVSGDSVPVDLTTCGAYSSGYNNYNGNNQNNEQNQESSQYMYQYDWYGYEISEDDSLDMAAVCKVVKNSGFHTFYNTSNGNLYSYSNPNSASDNIEDFMESTNSSIFFGTGKLSGGAVFGIVAFVGIALGASVALYLRIQATGVDDKNVGLIDPEEVETKGGEVA